MMRSTMRPARRARGRLLAALVGLAVVAGGCGAGSDDAADGDAPDASGEASADEAIYGGFPVDPPAPDEVVLTLEGDVRVELTMAELEALAVTEVTLDEPFVRRRETYRVIPLSVLFDLAGIGDGETVATIALNDYRYVDEVRALRDAQALLAVARDGAPIPMDAGGPIRLVYADDSSYTGSLDAWNWSLRTISVTDPP
jgi:hypothetical protein